MKNKKIISLILGIICLLLTYGICVQVKTINNIGTTVSRNDTENKLKDEILRYKEKYDNLSEDLTNSEKILEKKRESITENNDELAEMNNKIAEANKILGTTEVKGQGVTITLEDGTAPSNYIGDLNELIVHDDDIMFIVNELFNAGAEAVSVNDQRIVSRTSIDCDGNVIKINGEKIGAPFIIKAIGYPEQLAGIKRTGGYLWLLDRCLIKTNLVKEQNITIPKYSGAFTFNYAQNVD